MKKYVVFSSNQVRAYEFLVPITAMTWRTRTEFEPVVLLTETREHWGSEPTSRVVIDMLDRLGVTKHYIGMIEGPYRTSVQAQASRQHAAVLPSFQNEDYIMTTDVDGLPIDGAWHSNVDWSKSCHMRNASAWQYRWYTTFGFGARVGAWREFMLYQSGQSIQETLQSNLDRDLTPYRDTMDEWFFDEFLWNSRLKASRFYPDDCQLIERDVRRDRIDRGNWPSTVSRLNGYIDAHVLRPAHMGQNWERMIPLLRLLLGDNQMESLEQYHARYSEAAR